MKRNEVPRLRSLEKLEGIAGSQMAASESRLPPRRMPDGKQRNIQLAVTIGDVVVDDAIRLVGKRRIASEEDGMPLGQEQIHVGRGPPPVDTISTPIVFCRSCTNAEPTNRGRLVRG